MYLQTQLLIVLDLFPSFYQLAFEGLVDGVDVFIVHLQKPCPDESAQEALQVLWLESRASAYVLE